MTFEKGYALTIGVGSYSYMPWANIPISVADARAVAGLLQDPNVCGYPPEQVALLHDDRATRAGILAALEGLAGQTGPENTVLLCYCGHGDYGEDGHYYLTTHDTRLAGDKIAAGAGISQVELLEKLRAIPAGRLLLLFNACYSGELSPHLGLGDVEKSFGRVSLPQPTVEALLSTGEGRIIITASRPDQESWIGLGRLSIFTQALVDGLSGQGYVPNNRGYVSAYGLYEHLYFAVKERAAELGHTQEPELTVLKGVGPFPVSLYRGATSLGLFDEQEPAPAETAAREVSRERSEHMFKAIMKSVTAGDRSAAAGRDIRDSAINTGEQEISQTAVGRNIAQASGGGRAEVVDKSRLTMFDQRGQRVRSQYNIAGDFKTGPAQGREQAIAELENLRTALEKAVGAGALDEEAGLDAENEVRKALRQAQKPDADREAILAYLTRAKEIIGGATGNAAATGLARAISQAIETARTLF